MALLIVIAIVGLVLYQQGHTPRPRNAPARPGAAIPAPPPLEELKTDLMPISAEQAEAVNAKVPLSTNALESAAPFTYAEEDDAALSRRSAVDCLTAAIYYEASSESAQGQRSVAQVVLNRVRHPSFPKSVCGVVFQGSDRKTGCQFSFTCDGSLRRTPSRVHWERARQIAAAALSGVIEPSVGMATHYHTRWVVPYWSSSLDKIALIGAHIFYRWKGYWGHRAAFTGRYAGEAADLGEARAAISPLVLSTDNTVIDTAVTASPWLADDTRNLDVPSVPPKPTSEVNLEADRRRGELIIDDVAPKLVAPDSRASLPPL